MQLCEGRALLKHTTMHVIMIALVYYIKMLQLCDTKVSTYLMMRTAVLWAIMQQAVVIPYQSFGTTYRSHLQGPRIPEESG